MIDSINICPWFWKCQLRLYLSVHNRNLSVSYLRDVYLKFSRSAKTSNSQLQSNQNVLYHDLLRLRRIFSESRIRHWSPDLLRDYRTVERYFYLRNRQFVQAAIQSGLSFYLRILINHSLRSFILSCFWV